MFQSRSMENNRLSPKRAGNKIIKIELNGKEKETITKNMGSINLKVIINDW